jgi:archaellum component FlaG (FlaF/FlaG flagellin family)
MLEHTLHRVCTTYVNFVNNSGATNAAADQVAINVIVDEAADATADQVAVNAATIVNEAAHSVAGRVSAISDEAEGLVGA